mmetsp:Transcript_18593/g.47252  ORF Transcript_18593/g.47252 Transcript_18593/m.47252 type:complete len:136 (-) Transcript_18593:2-409(-)
MYLCFLAPVRRKFRDAPLNMARLEHIATGVEALAFNTHLDPRSDWVRRKQAAVAQRFMSGQAQRFSRAAVILTGLSLTNLSFSVAHFLTHISHASWAALQMRYPLAKDHAHPARPAFPASFPFSDVLAFLSWGGI